MCYWSLVIHKWLTCGPEVVSLWFQCGPQRVLFWSRCWHLLVLNSLKSQKSPNSRQESSWVGRWYYVSILSNFWSSISIFELFELSLFNLKKFLNWNITVNWINTPVSSSIELILHFFQISTAKWIIDAWHWMVYWCSAYGRFGWLRSLQSGAACLPVLGPTWYWLYQMYFLRSARLGFVPPIVFHILPKTSFDSNLICTLSRSFLSIRLDFVQLIMWSVHSVASCESGIRLFSNEWQKLTEEDKSINERRKNVAPYKPFYVWSSLYCIIYTFENIWIFEPYILLLS